MQSGDDSSHTRKQVDILYAPCHDFPRSPRNEGQLPERHSMIFEDACGIERSQMLQSMSVKKVETIEFGSLIENLDEKVEGVRQRPVKIKDKKSSFHSLYLDVRSTHFVVRKRVKGTN